MKSVTLNAEQELFVIPAAGGYSCLGFDVLERRTVALARELAALGHPIPAPALRGSLERYVQYRELCDLAGAENRRTGWRSKSELTPELVGLEGRRVEVIHEWSKGTREVSRFWVGRSTGYIPCHLQIARRNRHGGPAVCLGTILSVRVVR